jgi:hypothetical protein
MLSSIDDARGAIARCIALLVFGVRPSMSIRKEFATSRSAWQENFWKSSDRELSRKLNLLQWNLCLNVSYPFDASDVLLL